MTNPHYNDGGVPGSGSRGRSAPIRSEFSAVEAGFDSVEALKANNASPTFTGTATFDGVVATGTVDLDAASIVTVPTVAGVSDNSQKAASTSFVQAVLGASGALLPPQATHGGKFLKTDGTSAAWSLLTLGRSLVSSNSPMQQQDAARLWQASGSITLTFDAPSALGDGWFAYFENVGTGDVTLQHTSGSIDGLSSFILYPGAIRLVICNGSTLISIAIKGGRRLWSASGTYIVPPGITGLLVRAVGAGASGGSGQRGSTGVTLNGGPGGGGAETIQQFIPAPAAGSSVSVTVPSSTNGAAGATADSTPAAIGTSGGDALFGSYITARGGSADGLTSVLTTSTIQTEPGGLPFDVTGIGGNWTPGRLFSRRSSTNGSAGEWAGGHGGNGMFAGTSLRNGMRSLYGGGGGGAGGTLNTAGPSTQPGTGGGTGLSAGAIGTTSGFGGAPGVSNNPSAGTAGSAGTLRADAIGGDGGGGGGASEGSTGARGGDGVAPGGGGGGGGASRNGFASGGGGNGARGEVVLWEII